MWKIVHKQAPQYLDCTVEEVTNIQEHNTWAASRNNMYVTHGHKNSLKVNGTKAWNSLPPETKECKNYKMFNKLVVGQLRLDS